MAEKTEKAEKAKNKKKVEVRVKGLEFLARKLTQRIDQRNKEVKELMLEKMIDVDQWLVRMDERITDIENIVAKRELIYEQQLVKVPEGFIPYNDLIMYLEKVGQDAKKEKEARALEPKLRGLRKELSKKDS